MPGLTNIPNYFNTKSIKLSDGFIVVFDNKVSFRCAGFTIPKIVEFNEQVHKFGNATHKMLIPKIDMLPELNIELYEGYTQASSQSGEILQTGQKEGLFWKFKDGGQNAGRQFMEYGRYSSKGYDMLKGQYFLDKTDYKKVDIYILSNDLRRAVYHYEFNDLTLTKYTPYDLSYADESLCKWSLSFIFSSMKKEKLNISSESLGF